MTIGVCDVNPDETQRTVYFLRSQIKNNIIDNENVRFVSYNLDSVMLAQEPPSCAGFFVASLLIDNLNSQIIMGISIITNKTRRCMT